MSILVLLTILLLLGSLVCFCVAAFASRQPRVNLVALGLALWVLVELIHAFARVA